MGAIAMAPPDHDAGASAEFPNLVHAADAL